MSLLLALIFSRFAGPYRLAYWSALIFYGLGSEYWAYIFGSYDLYVLLYLLGLNALLLAFIYGLRINVSDSVPILSQRGAKLIFILLIISTFILFYNEFGGVRDYLSLGRQSAYLVRQGGSPLFDLAIFISLLFGSRYISVESTYFMKVLLIVAIVFLFLIGDRRMSLLVFFPLFLWLAKKRKSTFVITGILLLCVFILVGISRSGVELISFSYKRVLPFIVPNEPWLVFSIYKDVCEEGIRFYGKSYIDAVALLSPSSLRPEGLMPLSKWYMYNWHYGLWKQGNTYAFSPVAEAYINFGVMGFLLALPLSIFAGYVLKKVTYILHPMTCLGVTSYWVFIYPRLSYSNLLKDSMYVAVFSILIICFIEFKGIINVRNSKSN